MCITVKQNLLGLYIHVKCGLSLNPRIMESFFRPVHVQSMYIVGYMMYNILQVQKRILLNEWMGCNMQKIVETR